jgi:hypothetical protein
MCTRLQRKTDRKIIPIGEAARGMDNDYMTYFRTFRVQWLLNAKRSKMTAFAKNGSISGFGEPEIKFTQPAFPSAGWIGISNHSGGVGKLRRRQNCELHLVGSPGGFAGD